MSNRFLRSIGDVLRSLTSCANEAASQPREDREWQYWFPFELESVMVLNADSAYHFGEVGISTVLTELLALGVRLNEEGNLNSPSRFMHCAIPELGPVLQGITDETSLCDSTAIERVLPEVRHGMLKLIDTENGRIKMSKRAQIRQLGAIASTLSASRSVNSLDLQLSGCFKEPLVGAQFLEWLTYALFSKDSASSISSTEVNECAFRPEDVTGVTRVLGARNPSSVLLDTDDVSSASADDYDDDSEPCELRHKLTR